MADISQNKAGFNNFLEFNKQKAKLKRALEDLDEGNDNHSTLKLENIDKTGEVTTKVFTSILRCMGIEINSKGIYPF